MRRTAMFGLLRATPLTAIFISIFTLTVMLKSSTVAMQTKHYLVCKDIKSNMCITWNRDYEGALQLTSKMYPNIDYGSQCGYSDLKLYSIYQKFVTVDPFDKRASDIIFCKLANMIIKDPNGDLSIKTAKNLNRVPRQAPYSLRGRYRGQTQSQYLAIDHGNGKDDGKAEAHSAADSSRASVSGSSGMGQAQSQTMYDPSCEHCVGQPESEAESIKRRPYDSRGGASGGAPIGGSNLAGNGPYAISAGDRPGAHGGYGPNQSGRSSDNTLNGPNGNGQAGFGPNLHGINRNGAFNPNSGVGSEAPGAYTINQKLPYGNGEYGPSHSLPNGEGPSDVAPSQNVVYGNNQPGITENFRGDQRSFPPGTSVHGNIPSGSAGYSPHQVGAGAYPHQNVIPYGTGSGNLQSSPHGGSGFGTQGGGYSPPNQLIMPGFGSGNYGPGQHAMLPSGSENYGPSQSAGPHGSDGKEAYRPGQNGLQSGNSNGLYGPSQISGTGDNRVYGPSQGVMRPGVFIPGQQGTTSEFKQLDQTAPNGPYVNSNWPSTRAFSSPDGTTYYCCVAGPNNNPQYFKLDANGLPIAGSQTGAPYGATGQGTGSSVPHALLSPAGPYLNKDKPFVSGSNGANGPYGIYGTGPNQGNAYPGTYNTGSNFGPGSSPHTGGQYAPGNNEEQLGTGRSIPYGIPSGGQSGMTLPNAQSGPQGPGALLGPGNLQGGQQGLLSPGSLQGHGLQGSGGLQGQGGLQSPGGLQEPGGLHGQGGIQGPGSFQGPGGLPSQGGVQGPGGINGQGSLQGPGGMPGQDGVQGPRDLQGLGGTQGQGGLQGQGDLQRPGGLQAPGANMSPISQISSGSIQGPSGLQTPTNQYGSLSPAGGNIIQRPEGDSSLQGPHGQYNPGITNGQNGMQGPNGGVNSGQNGLQVPGGNYGSGLYTNQPGRNSQFIPGSTGGQSGLPNQFISGIIQNGYGTPTGTLSSYGPGTADRQNVHSPYGGGQNIGSGTNPYGQTVVPNQYGTGQGAQSPPYGNSITGTGQYGNGNGNGLYGYNANGKTDQNVDYAGIPQNVIDPNSIGDPVDGDDSEAEASVSQAANGTIATASSKGGNDKGRAQTHVHGAYTDSGSFSAQAEITGENKAANSEVTGNKKGASSNAQGSGRNNKSQANVQLGSETGSVLTGSQSQGTMHSSNTQVQGSVKGGMADAQARGPGSTSSQAQIGFTPYKEGDKSHDLQKAPFIGGGVASAQSSGRTGSSQSQLRGTFKYGITYNGGAQAGASLDKDTVFPNRLPFDKIDVYDESNKNINVISESTDKPLESVTENDPYSERPLVTENIIPTVNQADVIPSTELPIDTKLNTEKTEEISRDSEIEYGSHTHSDHHKTDFESPITPTRAPPIESRRSFQSTYSTNSGDYEYTTDKDDNNPEDYDVDDGFGPEAADTTDVEQGEYSTYNEFSRDTEPTHQSLHSARRKGLEVRQTTGGNTQHIVLGSLNNHDAEITQRNSEHPDESRVYLPGERVPGTGGYTIPVGFTGSVKSVASKDKTYVVGSKDSPSQAQTVSLTPGRGKVKYTHPANYARNINPKNLRSLYQHKPDDSNRYVSVSKSVTRDLDSEDHIRKQYSHTYYTKSSSCGYFTFTCTMVSGAEGRKKVCKPKIPTNPDGTPMRC